MATSRAPVQARGGGFGLDAELARKAAERYDYDMEREAREWAEAISGMDIGEDFGSGLKDGVVLCTLANKIHPGVVRRVETKSKMPFKQMENVSNFIKACRIMGVNEFDLFETVDLFELKDLGQVVRCIFSLGRAVQRNYPDFKGPTLGVKESVKNQRKWTSDQLAEARNAPALQTLGSFRTMTRQNTQHSNGVMLGADAAQSAYRAPPPPPPPSAEKIQQLSRFRSNDSLMSYEAPPQPEGELSPTGNESVTSKEEEVDAAVAVLAKDVSEKTTIKSSLPGMNSATAAAGPTAEEEAQAWVEAVLGEQFLANFGDSLKDGVMLCQLMNKIQPGSIKRIQNSPMPFKQMENVSSFIQACRALGVSEFDLFETVDLFNQKNIPQVVQCIHSLGRTLQKLPSYGGPTLGVKESTVNRRKFSEAQLRDAKSAVPVLAHGSKSVMDRHASNKSLPKPEDMPSDDEDPTPKPEGAKLEDPKPQGPSWLLERVASLKSVENAPDAAAVVGGSSSALPTRTVWS